MCVELRICCARVCVRASATCAHSPHHCIPTHCCLVVSATPNVLSHSLFSSPSAHVCKPRNRQAGVSEAEQMGLISCLHMLMHACMHVQVLSGDTVVIRANSTAVPPPERTLSLAHVTAPRLEKRPGQSEQGESGKDEVRLSYMTPHITAISVTLFAPISTFCGRRFVRSFVCLFVRSFVRSSYSYPVQQMSWWLCCLH